MGRVNILSNKLNVTRMLLWNAESISKEINIIENLILFLQAHLKDMNEDIGGKCVDEDI